MLFRPPSPQFLAVPHAQQRNSGDCLAACAVMACNYLKIPVRYDRLVKLLEIRSGIGTAFSNIEKLERLSIRVLHNTGGQLAQLYALLEQGWPTIASVQTGELPHWFGHNTLHAVLVVGMDSEQIYLNDRALPEGPISVPIGDFDLAWLAQDERYAVLMLARSPS